MWIKQRHRLFVNIIRPFCYLYIKLKYRARLDKKRSFKDGAIVMSNHVTGVDAILMGLLVKQQIYYLADKEILTRPFTGKLLSYFFHIIPKEISKNNDFAAIRYSMMVCKENGVIGLFPELNRTYSGDLGYINPNIIKLCKRLKKPIVIINIKGGYGVAPKWGKHKRSGSIEVSFKHVYSYQDYKDIDNEVLYKRIVNDLTVDDYNSKALYKGKSLAMNLEKVLYICPCCKARNTLASSGNIISCNECKLQVEYMPDLTLRANKDSFKFERVNSWYKYQKEEIKKDSYQNKDVIYSDEATIYMPKPYKKRVRLGEGTMYLYNDKFLFKLDNQTLILEHSKIRAVILYGNNKMNIYLGHDTYQVNVSDRVNLLKYLDMFNLIKYNDDSKDNPYLGL